MAAAGHQAEEDLAKDRQGARRQVHRRRRGIDPDGRRRRLLHDRRTIRPGHRARGLRQRDGHDRDRHVRGLRRAAGGLAQPDRALSRSPTRCPGVKNLINLPACPANVENLTALIVYFLTFQKWPPLDQYRRPLFAYGKVDPRQLRAPRPLRRRPVRGDVGRRGAPHRLLPLQDGLQGPGRPSRTVPTVRWNGGTNWPIGCGHPCIGCAEPNFWDTMTPFYRHLDGIPGSSVGSFMSKVDKVGVLATVGVGAAFAAHGLIKVLQRDRQPQTGSKPSRKR